MNPQSAGRRQTSISDLLARSLMLLGMRPVILLDSHLKQFNWLGFSRTSVIRQGLKRGIPFMYYRVALSVPTPDESAEALDRQERYRGVSLFSAVEYLLYVSLGIARHEFDVGNLVHRREARRWMAYARAVTDDLIVLFAKMRPSTVVVMQGYFVEGVIARQLAKHSRCQVVALERTFYSERLICEPLTGISVNKNSAMAWYYRLQDDAGSDVDDGFLEELVARIDTAKSAEHASPKTSFQWPEGRGRILFLGQCFTDSSVLFGTNGRHSTVEVVRVLLDYAKQRDAFAMFKLHPKERGGTDTLRHPYNQLTLRRLVAAGLPFGPAAADGHGSYFAIDSDNIFATSQLIRDADVVVTINSQGGLEALAMGKEVVLLGGAFYDQLGTTWNAPHLAVLPAILDSILRDGFRLWDRRLVECFLLSYFESYCIRKDASSVVEAIRTRRFVGF